VVTVNKDNLEELGPAAAIIAKAEGFDGHASAVKRRMEEGKGK
jgi:histidinol dehydrogenase